MLSFRSFVLTCCLALVGCLADKEAHYYYPDSIGQPSAQAFAWPARDSQEFSFLREDDEQGLDSPDRPVVKLQFDGGPRNLEELVGPASSLTVLLGESDTESVRAQARSIVDEASKRYPKLSTHIVVIDEDLRSVETGTQLHQVLARGRSFHEQNRPAGMAQGFSSALGMAWTMSERPNFVVVPLASGPDRLALYGDLRLAPAAATVSECPLAEAAARLEPSLLDSAARKLFGEWGPASEHVSLSITNENGVFVAILVPHDAPAERRAQCEKLAQELCTAKLAPIAVVLADTSWSWAECTSGDFVRARMPLGPDWSFVTGPVRQSVMLPQPPRTNSAPK